MEVLRKLQEENSNPNVSLYSLQKSIEHLASMVEKETIAISNLPDKKSIQNLSEKIESFMRLHTKSIPIGMVILMFITLLGVLFGKEAIEFIFNHPLYRIGS